METFETTLTGSDGTIAGIVTQLSKEAYQFTSFDNALHLTIAKDEHGKWTRLSGSEPYFSGWVDELVEKVVAQPKVVKKAAVKSNPDKKTTVATSASKKAKVSSAVAKGK